MVIFESEERKSKVKEHVIGIDLIVSPVEIVFIYN